MRVSTLESAAVPKKPEARSAALERTLFGGIKTRESLVLALAAIVIVTSVVFRSVLQADFVPFDDDTNIYSNPHFQSYWPFGVRFFWRHSYQQLYIPLSYTAYGLLSVAARESARNDPNTISNLTLDPRIFHLANLVLHIAVVSLVFLLLRRLCRKDLPALLGALVFSIHPLQVESVAWISELRELLGALFALLSLHFYLHYAEVKPVPRRAAATAFYVASLILALCSLLSKPSFVCLALLVPVFGVWACRKSIQTAFLEAIPYAFICLAEVAVTAHVQSLPPHEVAPVWLRPFVMTDACAFYLSKLVFPASLALDYGRRPFVVLSHWQTYVEWIVPGALAAGAIHWRRQASYVLFGLTCTAVALLPMSGLMPFVFQSISTTADRYMYFPMLGIVIILSCSLAALDDRKLKAAAVGIAAWLAVLGIVSSRQTLVWQCGYSLFGHAVMVNPNSAVAQNDLGEVLNDYRLYGLAAQHFSIAAALDPTFATYHLNLGSVYTTMRDLPDAAVELRKAVALAPNRAETHWDLGMALIGTNRVEEGVSELEKSIEMEPTQVRAVDWLGGYYNYNHDYSSAARIYELGVRSNPRARDLWSKYGEALFADRQYQQAIAPLEAALRFSPGDSTVKADLANAIKRTNPS